MIAENAIVREKTAALRAKYLTAIEEKEALSDRIAELSMQKKQNKIDSLTSEAVRKKTEPEQEAVGAPDPEAAEENIRVAKLNVEQRSASALLLGQNSDRKVEIDQLLKTKNPAAAPVADVKEADGWDNKDMMIWLLPLLAMLFAIGVFSLFREDYSRKAK